MIDLGTDLKIGFHAHIVDKILGKLSELQEKSSGYALQRILSLAVYVNKFDGATSYIKLPQKIEQKKACINVKNEDDACFAWSVASALYLADASSDRM